MTSLNTAAPANTATPGGDTVAQAFAKYNAHWHEYDAIYLTNQTGGSLASGDVVALDLNNDGGVALDDTLGSLRPFVVAQASIASAALGEFGRGGVLTAKAQGTINRGEYVKKSATSKAVETTGVVFAANAFEPRGALGVALTAAAAGLVTVLWFAFPDTSFAAAKSDRTLTTTLVINNTLGVNAVYTQTLEGKKLGTANHVRVRIFGYIKNDSGGSVSYTFDCSYGGSAIGSGLTFAVAGNNLPSKKAFFIEIDLLADGATNAQIAYFAVFMEGQLQRTDYNPSLAVDSTIDQTLLSRISMSVANANAEWGRDGFSREILGAATA